MATCLFAIPFPRDQVAGLVARFDPSTEKQLEELVPLVRQRGWLTKGEFSTVCAWKSPRARRHYEANSEEFVNAATQLALSTPIEELRIGALTLLRGVNWPTASVFLHWFHRDLYPILDVRTLRTLGAQDRTYTFDFWWAYTTFCRQKAAELGATMRELDKALWQFDVER